MNRITQVAILVALSVGTYVLMSSIYTVSEVEQAIITQFGEPVGAPVTAAGLKVKVPFIQDVNLIDKRVLEWDGNPSDMPTKDRVPLRDTLVADVGRVLDVGSLVPIQKGRKLVEREIFVEAAEKVRVFGIELLDIRFKRINYNESVL